ncbi:MAG TPA: hypothetical protein VHZ76_01080, partial [Gammaproteobacteria bacterium]|nr:hypothetical protein [Gammaproteobacteria bacterium]
MPITYLTATGENLFISASQYETARESLDRQRQALENIKQSVQKAQLSVNIWVAQQQKLGIAFNEIQNDPQYSRLKFTESLHTRAMAEFSQAEKIFKELEKKYRFSQNEILWDAACSLEGVQFIATTPRSKDLNRQSNQANDVGEIIAAGYQTVGKDKYGAGSNPNQEDAAFIANIKSLNAATGETFISPEQKKALLKETFALQQHDHGRIVKDRDRVANEAGAVVGGVLMDDQNAYVYSCGDVDVFVFSYNKSNGDFAKLHRISRRHKVIQDEKYSETQAELKRVLKTSADNCQVALNADGTRLATGHEITRAIGDTTAEKLGLIHEPQIEVLDLQEYKNLSKQGYEVLFMVACDGLSERMTHKQLESKMSQYVKDQLTKKKPIKLNEMATALGQFACQGDPVAGIAASTDNITLLLAPMKSGTIAGIADGHGRKLPKESNPVSIPVAKDFIPTLKKLLPNILSRSPGRPRDYSEQLTWRVSKLISWAKAVPVTPIYTGTETVDAPDFLAEDLLNGSLWKRFLGAVGIRDDISNRFWSASNKQMAEVVCAHPTMIDKMLSPGVFGNNYRARIGIDELFRFVKEDNDYINRKLMADKEFPTMIKSQVTNLLSTFETMMVRRNTVSQQDMNAAGFQQLIWFFSNNQCYAALDKDVALKGRFNQLLVDCLSKADGALLLELLFYRDSTKNVLLSKLVKANPDDLKKILLHILNTQIPGGSAQKESIVRELLGAVTVADKLYELKGIFEDTRMAVVTRRDFTFQFLVRAANMFKEDPACPAEFNEFVKGKINGLSIDEKNNFLRLISPYQDSFIENLVDKSFFDSLVPAETIDISKNSIDMLCTSLSRPFSREYVFRHIRSHLKEEEAYNSAINNLIE